MPYWRGQLALFQDAVVKRWDRLFEGGVVTETYEKAGDRDMLNDILHCCANDHVAKAAVASIGGDFARRVALVANALGLSFGPYAAREIRSFADEADASELTALVDFIQGSDHPVLDGVRYILQRALDDGKAARGGVARGEAAQKSA